MLLLAALDPAASHAHTRSLSLDVSWSLTCCIYTFTRVQGTVGQEGSNHVAHASCPSQTASSSTSCARAICHGGGDAPSQTFGPHWPGEGALEHPEMPSGEGLLPRTRKIESPTLAWTVTVTSLPPVKLTATCSAGARPSFSDQELRIPPELERNLARDSATSGRGCARAAGTARKRQERHAPGTATDPLRAAPRATRPFQSPALFSIFEIL